MNGREVRKSEVVDVLVVLKAVRRYIYGADARVGNCDEARREVYVCR